MGTVLIALLLVGVVAAIARGMARDRKNGKAACGGNCAQCKCGRH